MGRSSALAPRQTRHRKSPLARLPVIGRYRDLYRRLFTQEMADWPAAVRASIVERHVSLDWLVIGMEEAQDLQPLYDEVRRAGPMPDVRMIVFCSTAIDDFRRAVAPDEAEDRVREALAGQRRLYATLAASVPRGEVRPLDAGHLTLSFRHPRAVLQAVREILGR
jgi:hypothetical protein